jgi:tRNA 2-selenouridine synthase
MADSLDAVDLKALLAFDDIIDVRSPAEFAIDHVPGAINLPVLSNAQRAEVGTVYVQGSRFHARKIGAAHVARNIAHHLETTLADRPGGYAPLVYCWRGGQRSGAMATVLRQVGWRTTLLTGGYKTWRRYVTASLYDQPLGLELILLDGNTGSAKTEILGRAAARGVQVLDLEGLAGHRGSVFGAMPGIDQPSQKMFESRLLQALADLDPGRPVLVEAESSKIGDRMVPPSLWQVMQTAPRLVLQVDAAERARYLVAAYGDVARDPASLERALSRLPALYGNKTLASWREMAVSGAFEELAQALIETHYDPAYGRSSRQDTRPCLASLSAAALDHDGQEGLADQIAAVMVRVGI